MFRNAVVTVIALFTFSLSSIGWSQTLSPDFSPGPDMNIARMGQFHITLPDQSVLLIGGHGTGFTSLGTSELFSIPADSFALQTMNYTHDYFTAARLHDGRILIPGGAANLGVAPGYSHAEIYDPATGVYTPTGAMNNPRMGFGAATLLSGKVLLAGGWYSSNSGGTAEIFDPESGTFSLTGNLNTERAYPMIVPTADSGAIVFSGIPVYGGSVIEQVEYYDPESNSFSVLKDYLFSAEDNNWQAMTSSSYNRLVSDQQDNNQNYIFMAYNTSSGDREYTLFTVDPFQKTITRLNASTNLPNSQTHGFYAPVVDKSKEIVYLPAIKAGADPTQLDLMALNLQDSTLLSPDTTYTLPPSWYLGSAAFHLLTDGRILVSGGHSETGYNTNFSPVAHTFFIDPGYTYTGLPTSKPVSGYDLGLTNYPNPFNSATSFEFTLKKSGKVTLDIFDLNGKKVAQIANRYFSAGKHALRWDANTLASGIYLCRLTSPAGLEYRKITLVK